VASGGESTIFALVGWPRRRPRAQPALANGAGSQWDPAPVWDSTGTELSPPPESAEKKAQENEWVFTPIFTRDAERARRQRERKAKLPTAARRNIVSSKAPSAVPVERGASYT
jgi:hypothetical protein